MRTKYITIKKPIIEEYNKTYSFTLPRKNPLIPENFEIFA